MMILQLFSRTLVICWSYSSGVQSYHAYTFKPSATSAAATSSCVESGLLPVIYISAPPAASTLHRYAVFASRWMERAIRMPSKGLSLEKSSSRLRSSGQFFRTQSILCAPDGARLISLIALIHFLLYLVNYTLIYRSYLCNYRSYLCTVMWVSKIAFITHDCSSFCCRSFSAMIASFSDSIFASSLDVIAAQSRSSRLIYSGAFPSNL